MKKFLFIIGLVSMISMSFSQKDLSSAYNHYMNQYWDRAKIAIDKATENEVTKNDVRTWFYRGNIYLQLGYLQIDTIKGEYDGLCDNCGEIAFDAYQKAIQIDPTIEVPSMGISTPLKGLALCSDLLYNETVNQLKQNNLEKAFIYAEKCYKCNIESESGNYIYALTAEYVKKYDVAKERYRYLILKKQPTKILDAYIRLALIYYNAKDTLNALKAINARPANDTTFDVEYIINKAVILMWAGKIDEATATMDAALKRDSTNYLLLFGLGTAFSDQKKYNEAEKYLLKAMSIKPNEINVVYNLGNSYYNHYADIFNSLDTIKDNTAYNVAKEEGQILLRKALPLLEKARGLDPTDKNTLIMLKTIYPRLEYKEGEKEIFDEKLKDVEEKYNLLKKE